MVGFGLGIVLGVEVFWVRGMARVETDQYRANTFVQFDIKGFTTGSFEQGPPHCSPSSTVGAYALELPMSPVPRDQQSESDEHQPPPSW